MTERDIMRLFEKYDGEVCMSDFTPDELAELIATVEIDEENTGNGEQPPTLGTEGPVE